MKRRYLVAVSALMLGLIVLNGCTSGIAKEDFAKVQNDLADAQKRVAALEKQIATFSEVQKGLADSDKRVAAVERRVVAFSAYHIWFDQFTGLGNYQFADSATFIAEFGGAVEFIADSDLQTAWNSYLAVEKPLRDYVAGLPADQSTWTDQQTSRFTELAVAAYNALRPVGQALLSAIWNM